MSLKYNQMQNTEVYIVVKNSDGTVHTLEADDYNDVVNAYYGGSAMPADDAIVCFASCKGNPINPYLYTNFLSALQCIRAILLDEQRKELE